MKRFIIAILTIAILGTALISACAEDSNLNKFTPKYLKDFDMTSAEWVETENSRCIATMLLAMEAVVDYSTKNSSKMFPDPFDGASYCGKREQYVTSTITVKTDEGNQLMMLIYHPQTNSAFYTLMEDKWIPLAESVIQGACDENYHPIDIEQMVKVCSNIDKYTSK